MLHIINKAFEYFFKVVPTKWLDDLLKICETKNYNKVEEYVDKFMLEAYSASQVRNFKFKF